MYRCIVEGTLPVPSVECSICKVNMREYRPAAVALPQRTGAYHLATNRCACSCLLIVRLRVAQQSLWMSLCCAAGGVLCVALGVKGSMSWRKVLARADHPFNAEVAIDL
eukprot:5867303-Amphidinium_carterae.1